MERQQLPLIIESRPDARSLCGACIGACCVRNTVLPLSPPEAAQLTEAGTEMRQLPKDERDGNKPGRGREFYVFDSDCGNLVDDPESGARVCGQYASRPRICREFQAGSFSCMAIRAQRLDQPDLQERA